MSVRTSSSVVSGSQRFKFFRRPVLPRALNVPPNILLAPAEEVALSLETGHAAIQPEVESSVKDAEVQTMYRDSDAQTIPYAPDYVLPADGTQPEVLLLAGLNLPLEEGVTEEALTLFHRAQAELNLNSSLPPFTDESSLILRQRLMETLEVANLSRRSNELDQYREERIENLTQTLQAREELIKATINARCEELRNKKIEEIELKMKNIRIEKVQTLRRLAQKRSKMEPSLLSSTKKNLHGIGGSGVDIIDEYFNHSSAAYAPLAREGKTGTGTTEPILETTNNLSVTEQPRLNPFDIASRTVALDNFGNLLELENTMPRGLFEPNSQNILFSKTAPVGAGHRMGKKGTISVAEPRQTSAAIRQNRQKRRDVEHLHTILLEKKELESTGVTDSRGPSRGDTAGAAAAAAALMAKKPKGRPPTPDYTQQSRPPTSRHNEESNEDDLNESTNSFVLPEDVFVSKDKELHLAVLLLQRLIRGRAVQNILFEGRSRRALLISELRAIENSENPSTSVIDGISQSQSQSIIDEEDNDINNPENEVKAKKAIQISKTTVQAVAGSITSSVLSTMANEKSRIEVLDELEALSDEIILDRIKKEALEAGRRQRK